MPEKQVHPTHHPEERKLFLHLLASVVECDAMHYQSAARCKFTVPLEQEFVEMWNFIDELTNFNTRRCYGRGVIVVLFERNARSLACQAGM